MPTGDLYNQLGVAAGASADEIKAAYHQAARRFHPDANSNPGSSETFRLLAEAYDVLSDATQRSAYDAARARAAVRPLFGLEPQFSRQMLPASREPQIVYVLLEIQPTPPSTMPAPPLNLSLVIDRSTSMQGERLDHVRGAVLHLIDGLKPTDTFSVVAFSDRAEVIVGGQPAQQDRTLAKAKVSTLSAHGGTEILQGLLCGLTELHRHLSPTAINHVLLLTDGRTYGDEDDCLMLASLAATDGIVITGLGLGDEWNDKFVDELTGRTGGTALYVRSAQDLTSFMQQRIRALGNFYGERLAVDVALDARVDLISAFKVHPEPGPVPIEQPLRLGGLPYEPASSLLLKFRLPPLDPGLAGLARLSVQAEIVSQGRKAERRILDLQLPVVTNPPDPGPPPAVIEALSQLSQYQMQERAWQQAAGGDVAGAVDRLKALGTRLMAAGQPELARLALTEALRIEETRVWSEDAKKQLKYGTRALIGAPIGVTRQR